MIAPNLELLAHHTGSDDNDNDMLWAMAWAANGTDIELIQTTGLDIIDTITTLHDRIRSELGKRVLRHLCSMPCPRCGGLLSRLDGTMIVDCSPRHGGCGGSWTEREYKLLVGMHVEDEMDRVTKQLLDEAYTRLDSIQQLADNMANLPNDTVMMAGAAKIIVEELSKRIAGHPRPDQRTAEEARADATKRQDADEQYSWVGERPYRPPKRRKIRRPAGPPEHPVAVVSRSVITEDPTYDGKPADRSKICSCNTIHAGEC